MKFTDFLDFSLKNLPQAFVLAVFGASGENVRIFMIFLIFMKNNISDDEKLKNQKNYENHVFRQSFNTLRDGKS